MRQALRSDVNGRFYGYTLLLFDTSFLAFVERGVSNFTLICRLLCEMSSVESAGMKPHKTKLVIVPRGIVFYGENAPSHTRK